MSDLERCQAELAALRNHRYEYGDDPGYRLGVADWVAEEVLILIALMEPPRRD